MEKKKKGMLLFFNLIALFLFIWIANNVNKQGPILFDTWIIEVVETFRSHSMTTFMEWITAFGGKKILSFILIIGAFFLLFKYRSYVAAFCFVILVPLSSYFNRLLKGVFVRERPEINPHVDALGYSFPSGHSTSAMATYGFLIFILYNTSWNFKRVMIFFLALLIFLIGISRIYVHAHYPTDVVAGFSFGFICLSTMIWIYQKLMKQ